jgi:hypothetical protein
MVFLLSSHVKVYWCWLPQTLLLLLFLCPSLLLLLLLPGLPSFPTALPPAHLAPQQNDHSQAQVAVWAVQVWNRGVLEVMRPPHSHQGKGDAEHCGRVQHPVDKLSVLTAGQCRAVQGSSLFKHNE